MKTPLLIFTASLALIAIPNFNRASAGDDGGTGGISPAGNGTLSSPQFPRDFQWEGRYIVSDLDVDVPFSWQGNDGNGQMIAGGEQDPIYFTNLLWNDKLYTKTYKWPSTVPPASDECVCLGTFTLEQLNACLSSSRYVGTEILQDKRPRRVHHFRIAVVVPVSPPPHPFTIALMEGDVYVDEEDSSKFWKVLHFGYQNILDPALDEWIVMQKFKATPGEVTVPDDCNPATCPNRAAFSPSWVCK